MYNNGICIYIMYKYIYTRVLVHSVDYKFTDLDSITELEKIFKSSIFTVEIVRDAE